jgi:hypothetical protein
MGVRLRCNSLRLLVGEDLGLVGQLRESIPVRQAYDIPDAPHF